MKLLAVMTAIFAATPCAAQTDPSGPPGHPSVAADDGVSVTIGIAPVFSPAWQGSSDATLSIFPDLRLNFMQAYFGIDAGQSARTGLARYNAKGGVLSYGMGGTVIQPRTPRSALTLFTSLENLGGEPGNSPLVEERGRRAQFTLGIGYGFRLGL